jgi:hypothetical protein
MDQTEIIWNLTYRMYEFQKGDGQYKHLDKVIRLCTNDTVVYVGWQDINMERV